MVCRRLQQLLSHSFGCLSTQDPFAQEIDILKLCLMSYSAQLYLASPGTDPGSPALSEPQILALFLKLLKLPFRS